MIVTNRKSTSRLPDSTGSSGTFLVLKESPDELHKLFDTGFMKRYTNFNSFEEFTFSGAVFVNWTAPEIMGSREAFDRCVLGKSRFDSWEEMYTAAKAQKKGKRQK